MVMKGDMSIRQYQKLIEQLESSIVSDAYRIVEIKQKAALEINDGRVVRLDDFISKIASLNSKLAIGKSYINALAFNFINRINDLASVAINIRKFVDDNKLYISTAFLENLRDESLKIKSSFVSYTDDEWLEMTPCRADGIFSSLHDLIASNFQCIGLARFNEYVDRVGSETELIKMTLKLNTIISEIRQYYINIKKYDLAMLEAGYKNIDDMIADIITIADTMSIIAGAVPLAKKVRPVKVVNKG